MKALEGGCLQSPMQILLHGVHREYVILGGKGLSRTSRNG